MRKKLIANQTFPSTLWNIGQNTQYVQYRNMYQNIHNIEKRNQKYMILSIQNTSKGKDEEY